MGTSRNDLVVDLMSGSGTTAKAAYKNERFSIICDSSEEYTEISEKRLGIRRLNLSKKLITNIEDITAELRAKKLKLTFKNGSYLSDFDETQEGQIKLSLV